MSDEQYEKLISTIEELSIKVAVLEAQLAQVTYPRYVPMYPTPMYPTFVTYDTSTGNSMYDR